MSGFVSLFFKRRMCWRPTLLGSILIFVLIAIILRYSLVGSYYYLAVNDPIESKTMVIEGWVPTYAIKQAVQIYKDEGYDRMIVTGIPIVNYEFIAPYRNTAEATILALRYYGVTDSIYLANIPTNIFVDRTYNTALLTKELFFQNDWPHNFNIFSVGVHSRRSRFLFRKAFGSEYDIGIIAPRDRTFLPDSWWKSSKGLRQVSNELMATLFVQLFFYPDKIESKKRLKLGKYYDSIYYNREDKLIDFSDSTTSRFSKEERENFTGFKYFDPDINYRVKARFIVDTTSQPFEMLTNTERKPVYRKYAVLEFKVNDTLQRLEAYQNMGFVDHPVYGKSLFVPFMDKTNGIDTYDAGRYMDIDIADNDSIILDFNTAYNPYCAYYDRWSCPLVPLVNQLDVSIRAGEKKYK